MDESFLKDRLSREGEKDMVVINDDTFGWITDSLKNPMRIIIHQKLTKDKNVVRPQKKHINVYCQDNKSRTTSFSEFLEGKKSNTSYSREKTNFLFSHKRPLTSIKKTKDTPKKSRPFTNILLNKFLNIEQVYTNKRYTPKKLIGYKSRRPSSSLNNSKNQSGSDLHSKDFIVQGNICKLK